jgi:hypothetical protein
MRIGSLCTVRVPGVFEVDACSVFQVLCQRALGVRGHWLNAGERLRPIEASAVTFTSM